MYSLFEVGGGKPSISSIYIFLVIRSKAICPPFEVHLVNEHRRIYIYIERIQPSEFVYIYDDVQWKVLLCISSAHRVTTFIDEYIFRLTELQPTHLYKHNT